MNRVEGPRQTRAMRWTPAPPTPLGLLGRIAERVAVTRHLRRLLTERAQCVRDVAQGWDDDAAARFSISG